MNPRMLGALYAIYDRLAGKLPFARTAYRHGPMAARSRFADIRARVKGPSPVLVDGGANRGHVTDLFLWQFPAARIHVFEPIPSLARHLTARYAPWSDVTVHANALGAESRDITFNVTQSDASSSVLQPSSVSKGYQREKLDVQEVITVPQVRLDEALDGPVDVLKLDLQGYELEALKGCENLIEEIKLIVTEVEFVPLYDQQPLFSDVDRFLHGAGFKLLNLYELYTHRDGQLTAGDALYVNERFEGT